MDKLTLEQRHRNMQNVHSKGTKIEILFAKLLHEAGVKYTKNDLKAALSMALLIGMIIAVQAVT